MLTDSLTTLLCLLPLSPSPNWLQLLQPQCNQTTVMCNAGALVSVMHSHIHQNCKRYSTSVLNQSGHYGFSILVLKLNQTRIHCNMITPVYSGIAVLLPTLTFFLATSSTDALLRKKALVIKTG